MNSLLTIILIVSWIVFVWSVLMMTPKWWLWLWLWWASAATWDYWSKKSMESKLKIVAIISAVIFLIACIALPFVK